MHYGKTILVAVFGMVAGGCWDTQMQTIYFTTWPPHKVLSFRPLTALVTTIAGSAQHNRHYKHTPL